MAVATLGQSWKALTFDSSITLSGALSGKSGTQSIKGNFNGVLEVNGSVTYGSPVNASGRAQVVGSVNNTIRGFGSTPPTNINSDTGAGGVSIAGGKLTAVIPGDGSSGPITMTGAINTQDFSASGKVSFPVTAPYVGNGSGKWSGSFAPAAVTPPDIGVTAFFNPRKYGALEVVVQNEGSIQPAPTATTPIATVTFSYIDSAGKTLGNLKDKIPFYWNQNRGDYELTQLPAPPLATTGMLITLNYNGGPRSLKIAMPPRPVISIDDASVGLLPGGSGTLQFHVTLSSPTLANVTVKFTTVDGTAVVGQDYTKKTGTLTFKPGGPLTQTISIPVQDDKDGILSEDFKVVLSNSVWGLLFGNGSTGHGKLVVNGGP